MMKKYLRLVYVSIIFALFVLLLSNLLSRVSVNNLEFSISLIVLICIQLSLYTYFELPKLLECLSCKLWITIIIVIDISYREFKNELLTIYNQVVDYKELNVVRC